MTSSSIIEFAVVDSASGGKDFPSKSHPQFKTVTKIFSQAMTAPSFFQKKSTHMVGALAAHWNVFECILNTITIHS